MVHKPARDTTTDPRPLTPRNPRDSLHYEQLLQVCGTATNAFVNLAASNGVRARRLLLLSPDHQTKHVVAEVWLRDRWVIADPLYRIMYHDEQGEFLTKEQLRDPAVFKEATQAIPGYLEIYTYELTSYVHLGRIPVIGDKLQSALDSIFPRWQEAFDWTLLLERGSFALTVLASLLLFCSLVARLIVNWYGNRRVPIPPVRLRTDSAV